jgi:hypothetical protein
MDNPQEIEVPVKKHKLSERQKFSIMVFATQYRKDGTQRLVDRSVEVITRRFGISPRVLSNILKEYDDKIAAGHIWIDLSPADRSQCGIDSGLTPEVKENLIDLHNLTQGKLTIRQLSEEYWNEFGVWISKSTMQRYMDKLGQTLHSSYVKPTLTNVQVLNRIQFILQHFIYHAGHGIYRFRCTKHWVHLDEKWFYMTRLKTKRRKLPDDDRFDDNTTRHKSHIEKIMFLSVIGCPQTVDLPDGTQHHFDGKVGIFPFIKMSVAKRNSVNRRRGDPVMECLNVTSETYLDMITKPEGVLSKLKEKMFWLKDETIVCQHDGAPGHTGEGNEEFLRQAGIHDGWNIQFITQPAQSPDMNKNDLCFFNSLAHRADELKGNAKSLPALLEAVKRAFSDYDEDTLVRIHAFQYATYREILKSDGSNQYYQPHSDIRKRQNMGLDVTDFNLDQNIYQNALSIVLGSDSEDD